MISEDIFQFIDYGCIVKLFTPTNISNDQQKNFIKKFVNRIDFYFNVDGIVTDKNNKEELFIILKNKILKPKPLNLINNIFDKDAFKKDTFIASKNFKTSTQALSKEVEEVIPFIRNRRHAIDVGARHGIFSCFLLKNNFKKISCFELVPYFREAFLKNTNSNYIDFYNIGLFDSETRIKFSGRAGKQIQSIGKDGLEVYSLDYFNFKEVDLIKIDVDGCERQILRGARNTIIKHRPVLHIETEEIQLKFDPEGLNKLEDIYSWLLDELDYTSITLERNTILHPKN